MWKLHGQHLGRTLLCFDHPLSGVSQGSDSKPPYVTYLNEQSRLSRVMPRWPPPVPHGFRYKCTELLISSCSVFCKQLINCEGNLVSDKHSYDKEDRPLINTAFAAWGKPLKECPLLGFKITRILKMINSVLGHFSKLPMYFWFQSPLSANAVLCTLILKTVIWVTTYFLAKFPDFLQSLLPPLFCESERWTSHQDKDVICLFNALDSRVHIQAMLKEKKPCLRTHSQWGNHASNAVSANGVWHRMEKLIIKLKIHKRVFLLNFQSWDFSPCNFCHWYYWATSFCWQMESINLE